MANEKQLIDPDGNIYIADTDSFTIELELIRDDGGEFSPEDKVLATVMDSGFDKTYFKRVFDIEDGVAYFRMNVEDAKRIPAGDQTWSFSVLVNAVALPDGSYTADEKITPFNGWRTYHVEEDPSNGRAA
jgi:hypothetical protein